MPVLKFRNIVVTGVIVLANSVAVQGHDISHDSRFDSSADPIHACHHMRVDYWNNMSELADHRVDLLRYSHSPERREKLAETARQLAQSMDKSAEFLSRYLDSLNEAAERYGCYPWP